MRFQDLKIRTKLVLIMVLTGMSVLSLAMIAMVAIEYNRTRQVMTAELETISAIVSWNCGAALAFQDQTAAKQTLAALAAKPGIVAAYLYDNQGKVFAFNVEPNKGNSEPVSPGGESGGLPHRLSPEAATVSIPPTGTSSVRAGHLHVVRPVELDGDRMGFLHLVDDQSELGRMAKGVYLITMTIIIVSLALIILLSSRLQRVFSDPVHKLVVAMKGVTKGKDFSTRVEKVSHDEFGVLVDVFNEMLTEIHERDGQLANHRERLEKEVADRTSQLAKAVKDLESITKEALEAKDAAEAASRAKSEFLATMSHEIRTPMNGVLGMTELLIGSGLQGKQCHFANSIQHSGQALLAIINDILDFSKIESGKLELDRHEFDARVLVQETAEMMAEQAQRKGLELTVDMPLDTSFLLFGDSHRLRQVLLNLLSNAVKFTSDGDISISLEVLEKTGRQLSFRCEVSDTGIGIAEETRAKIFGAFHQADSSTTRRYGGTGLGLTISSQLVKLMGGSIGVENRKGPGSTFWFELEMERQVEPPNQRPRELKTLSGIRVLLVDDNALNREILQTQALNWGMTCVAVDSAEAGLAALRSAAAEGRPFQCAILDWLMPVVDGIELARRIQNDTRIPDLKLAMLSSAGFDDESMRAASVGINCYLNKPVRQELLYRTLCKLFDPGDQEKKLENNSEENIQDTFQGARILLAEDNPMNQEVACGMLEFDGCEVVVVDEGRAAVLAFSPGEFDLVMMDCHMPIMDGFEASEQIRAKERTFGHTSRIPIIALTADVQKGIRDRCMASGMDDYLSKPFTAKQLGQMLTMWLGDWTKNRAQNGRTEIASTTEPEAEVTSEMTYAQSLQIDEQDILDPDILNRISQLQKPGGPNILHAVIQKFLEGYESSTNAVLTAIEEKDSQALFSAAHFLKSGYANLGAMTMAHTCKILEEISRGDSHMEASALVGEFIEENEKVKRALHQLLKQGVNV